MVAFRVQGDGPDRAGDGAPASQKNRIERQGRDLSALEQPPDSIEELRLAYIAEQEQRKELEEHNRELLRRIHDLLGVYDVILAINSSRTMDATFDLIAQALVTMVGAESCVIFLWNAQSQRFDRQLGLGIVSSTTGDDELRDSPLSAALVTRDVYFEVEDLQTDDQFDYSVLSKRGIRSVLAAPLKCRDTLVGLLYVGFTSPHQFDERDRAIVKVITDQAAAAVEHYGLAESLKSKTDELQAAWDQMVQYARDLKQEYDVERQRSIELRKTYVSAIKVLAAAVEARDPYTGGHIERVTSFCLAVARELGWDDDKLSEVEMGAALHDIGKIGVEDAILRKPGKLTQEEYHQMKAHPEIAARMLSGIDFLEPVIPYVLYHQERYDGMGYPYGLRGEEIPMEGRLVAVADGFDAMTSERPYRQAMLDSEAIEELRRCAGSQFDPAIVAAFVRAWERGNLA